MIIGHLPAGYIISNALYHRLRPHDISPKLFSLFGILGAIVPDIDMFYFYLIDNRQYHHHLYITHFPLLWVSFLLLSSIWFKIGCAKKYAVLATLFSLNGLAHMILDSIVGDIWWFAPFIDKSFAFFTVPDLYEPWWFNFIFHWSFMLEIVLVVWAFYLCLKNKQSIKNRRI